MLKLILFLIIYSLLCSPLRFHFFVFSDSIQTTTPSLHISSSQLLAGNKKTPVPKDRCLLFKPPLDLINANTFLHYNVCITSQDTRCLSPSPSRVHLPMWYYQVSSIPGSLSALYKVLSLALRFI